MPLWETVNGEESSVALVGVMSELEPPAALFGEKKPGETA
jgi:hypothetical protein